jgi:hypothetical protein
MSAEAELSVASVHTILHKHLNMHYFCRRWLDGDQTVLLRHNVAALDHPPYRRALWTPDLFFIVTSVKTPNLTYLFLFSPLKSVLKGQGFAGTESLQNHQEHCNVYKAVVCRNTSKRLIALAKVRDCQRELIERQYCAYKCKVRVFWIMNPFWSLFDATQRSTEDYISKR